MQSNRPTPEQCKYLAYFTANEDKFSREGWTQNPLAVWKATHPEGTTLTPKALLWRIEKVFTAMKSQGWVTETHVEHRYQDDEVNTRRFEETLYRITERGKRALIEAGQGPVITRRVDPTPQEEEPMTETVETPTAETIVFSDGPADGRVVTLPVGHHDQVLFSAGGREVRYRRSRRPEVDGHAVFIPVEGSSLARA